MASNVYLKKIAAFILISIHFELSAMTCLTSECHSEYKNGPNIHSPLKATNSCEICHKVKGTSAKHPVLFPIDKKSLTTTCLTCHENFMTKLRSKFSHIHSVIEKEGCLSCHDAHKSKERGLTKKSPRYDLCIDCHTTQHKASLLQHHRIKDFDKGCLSCHRPHGANNNKLLVHNDQNQLCMDCHKKPQGEVKALVLEGVKSIHAPVKNGECSKCHTPHGSNQSNILTKNYANAHIGSFNIDNSALCFQCHKQNLVNDRITDSATAFRDGTKNLHHLHVAGQKRGKNCGVCHNGHNANNDSLIRDQFNYKGISVPLLFKKNSDGGNCATVCHKETSYSRKGRIRP